MRRIFKRPDGTTSATLYDDFSKGPVASDWYDEVRTRMPLFLGKSEPETR